MALDVVCGMQVNEQSAEANGLISQYEGRAYYFCSAQCKRQFDEGPQRYAPPAPHQAGQQTGERYIG